MKKSFLGLVMIFLATCTVPTGGVQAQYYQDCNECGTCDCDFCDLTECPAFTFRIGVPIMKVEEKLEWAFSNVVASRSQTIYNACWDWCPGVRVGAGFLLPCPNWALDVEYTYLSAEGKSSQTPPAGAQLFPMLGGSIVLTTAIAFEMDYHLIDVTIARECCVCDTLKLSPFAGFRALLVDRVAVETNTGGLFTNSDDGGSSNTEYRHYGLVTGFNWQHCVLESFRFNGHFAGSVLVGEENRKLRRRQLGALVGSVDSVIDCHPIAGVEVGAGISYDYSFCDWDFTLSLAYEFAGWHDFAAMACEDESPSTDPFERMNNTVDLGLHGVSLGAGVSF